ncbi:MAG: hypothetical protein ACKO9F_18545, partial [Caldilinea sp.]
MKKRSRTLVLWLMLSMVLLLSACVPAAMPASEPAEAAPAAGPGQTNVVYALPDLGGRVVQAAMAND